MKEDKPAVQDINRSTLSDASSLLIPSKDPVIINKGLSLLNSYPYRMSRSLNLSMDKAELFKSISQINEHDGSLLPLSETRAYLSDSQHYFDTLSRSIYFGAAIGIGLGMYIVRNSGSKSLSGKRASGSFPLLLSLLFSGVGGMSTHWILFPKLDRKYSIRQRVDNKAFMQGVEQYQARIQNKQK